MILINGQENNQINIADRGLHYGDGLFETIEVILGKPVFLKEHLQRLSGGCSRLKIPPPDSHQLSEEARQVCNNATHAVLKIIITRGSGGRGYGQPEMIQPTRIISLYPFPEYPAAYSQNGVTAVFCNTRLGLNPALAGLKHLNRLEQVMARSEWSGRDIQEGIMLDLNNHVVEGTMTNLFYVKESIVHTAPIRLTGVAGVMRGIILKLLSEIGLTLIERDYGREELLLADECFFCNSVIGVWPILQIEGIKFAKGDVAVLLQEKIRLLKQEDSGYAL